MYHPFMKPISVQETSGGDFNYRQSIQKQEQHSGLIDGVRVPVIPVPGSRIRPVIVGASPTVC